MKSSEFFTIDYKKLLRLFNFFLLIIFISTFFSCKKKSEINKDNPYIFANTGGIISKNDPVKIVFANKMIDAKAVGNFVDNGIILISPSVNGKAVWTDDHTVEFRPDQPFNSDTEYDIQVNLDKIASNVPASYRIFSFNVRTIKMSYDIAWKGWKTPDAADYSQQSYYGILYSSDNADNATIEKLLSATLGADNLKVNWNHEPNQLIHSFEIIGIKRNNSERNLEIKWFSEENSKNPIIKKLNVAPVDRFEVHDIFLQNDGDFSFTVNFTDPLELAQALEGLISIENYNEQLRFEIEGNNVIVFPNERIVGKRKVIVEPGMRNSKGQALGKMWSTEVDFQDNKPLVRFVNKGNIMPDNNGLILPFEAINLQAIDVEIVKIFSDNIMQYYQTYDGYENDYEINRVGRIILQQKIVLSSLNTAANNTRWVKYGLDLNKLIASDQNAIYQVRIGFRKAYSTYKCTEAISGEGDEAQLETMPTGYDANIISIYDNNYNGFGMHDSYDWENRNNPCSNAYYNREKFAVQSVYRSNTALIAKGNETGYYFVAATDIITAKPQSGVELKFYDFQQQEIASSKTDNKGIAKVNLSRVPFMLVATNGKDKSYLSLKDAEAVSLSKFDVSGESGSKGLKAFLYADRGVWRPGDSIFLNAMIADKTESLPAGHPVNFEVKNPLGAIVLKKQFNYQKGSIMPLYFNTSADAPTGVWSATIKIGGAEFNKQLNIEAIKPNKLKIELIPNKSELLNGSKSISVSLQANWLIGNPAAGMRATVDAFINKRLNPFKGLESYTFFVKNYSKNAERRIFEGGLNNSGHTDFKAQINPGNDIKDLSNITFKTVVYEDSGNFSTDYSTAVYSPFSTYIGLKLPVNEWSEPVISENKDNRIEFISVDANGKPLPNVTVNIKVLQTDWRWWWDGNDDAYNYMIDETFKPVLSKTVSTDINGKGSFNFNPSHWGRYFIRIDHQKGHSTGGFVYAGYPNNEDEQELNSMVTSLKINAESKEVKVGEPVKLSFEGTTASRALITVENSAGIVFADWYELKSGNNNISIKTDPSMGAHCYFYITLLQPHNHPENDLPIRMYGVIPISIINPDLQIKPQITMADEIRPDVPVKLTVTEAKGRRMYYTVDIVDEGLLSLTKFVTPDPFNYFNAKEALMIRTWDLFDKVIGAYGGRLSGIFAIGGDMAAQQVVGAPKANRFKPAVVHLGPFELNKGSKAIHNFTIPNYMGAVRVSVIARNEDAYGNAEKSIKVSKPLLVTTTLPRTLAPGDHFNLPVNVFVTKQSIKNVAVSLNDESGMLVMDGKSKSLSFSSTGDQMVYFPVTVTKKEGVAKLKVTATGNKEIGTELTEIQIENPNPPITFVKNLTIQKGGSDILNSKGPGVAGSNTASLDLSTFPSLNLSSRLDFLINYPYGCLEQTISTVFPQVFLSDVTSLNKNAKDDIAANIKVAMNKLSFFLTPEGGLTYWPGTNNEDQYCTSYALHFMLAAKNAGYAVNHSLMESLIKYQHKASRSWNLKDQKLGLYLSDAQITQAYRLYTLALNSTPELAAMNQLRNTNDLSFTARNILAAAFAISGKKDIAKTVMNTVTNSKIPTPYADFGYTFGSDMRDLAFMLITATAMEKKEQAAILAREIASKFSSNNWYATYSIASGLWSVANYFKKYPPASGIHASFILNGKTISVKENANVFQISLGKIGTINSLKIKNSGDGVLYATLTHTGRPEGIDLTEIQQNLMLKVDYLDKNDHAVNYQSLAKGTEFFAYVTIRNLYPGPVNELALNQIFAAGWEIVNDRMQGINHSASGLDYQDFRDDRVYSFFDLGQNQSKTVKIKLIAAYPGEYYLPPTSVAAMYNNSVQARKSGIKVKVF